MAQRARARESGLRPFVTITCQRMMLVKLSSGHAVAAGRYECVQQADVCIDECASLPCQNEASVHRVRISVLEISSDSDCALARPYVLMGSMITPAHVRRATPARTARSTSMTAQVKPSRCVLRMVELLMVCGSPAGLGTATACAIQENARSTRQTAAVMRQGIVATRKETTALWVLTGA